MDLFSDSTETMDPRYSAQDVARCDLCEIAIAQNYCDFCHVYLCKPCIGEHISDEYDKHKIVPFHQRRSTLIYPKCNHIQKRPANSSAKIAMSSFVLIVLLQNSTIKITSCQNLKMFLTKRKTKSKKTKKK